MWHEIQRDVEILYSRKNIRKHIVSQIEASEELVELIDKSVPILENWLAGEYYASKNRRLAEYKASDPDLRELVHSILEVVLPIERPVLYTQVVGQLASELGLSEKSDGVKTIAEILAVLVDIGFYTIFKEDRNDSLKIVSDFKLDDKLRAYIAQTKYLPPMVCPPRKVQTNYDSGYLTKKESMILGHGTFHEGEICLDSINKFNQVALSLDVELLKTYSEVPKKVLDDPERKAQWEKMVVESYKVYHDLVKQGNQFWLTHKVDKRGRTYAQGYHCSTQGNSFRKAIIDLHEQEVIEGVE